MPKAERPKITEGSTFRRVTGCGSLYITVSKDPKSIANPIEVFARLGKAGGCAICQNEALSRCITLGLKWGIPAEDFAKELEELKCPSALPLPQDTGALSCPDAISRSLKVYLGIWKDRPNEHP